MSNDESREDLVELWDACAQRDRAPGTEQGLLVRGAVIRVNLKQLLVAVMKTAKAALKIKTLALEGLDLLAVGDDILGAIVATRATFQERVSASQYLVLLALCNIAGPCEPGVIGPDVDALSKADPASFPWYLGLTADVLESARVELGEVTIEEIVERLRERGLVRAYEGRSVEFDPEEIIVWSSAVSR